MTFSQTEDIIYFTVKGGIGALNFMKYDFPVTKVALALFVEKQEARLQHVNRASHGVVINTNKVAKRYVFSDKKCITVEQNEILYLPRGSSYKVETESSGDCYAINFELSEDVDFPPFLFRPKNPLGYINIFEKAHLAWKNKRDRYAMKCKVYLYEILMLMQGESCHEYISSSVASVIDPALKQIHQNYTTDPLEISELSRMCGISEDYFRKVFHKRFGTSPVKYINLLKLQYAKELLRSEMLSVAEIAELSGFGDPSYFNREFKKAVGVSPGKYR